MKELEIKSMTASVVQTDHVLIIFQRKTPVQQVMAANKFAMQETTALLSAPVLPIMNSRVMERIVKVRSCVLD